MSKSKKIYRFIMLIVVVSITTFLLTTAWIYKKGGLQPNYLSTSQVLNSEFAKKIFALKQIIDSEYLSEMKEEDLVEGAIKGYVTGLGDPYTEYFTKKEMDAFKTETNGNYVGIGIYMFQNQKENVIMVLTTVEGSPAEKAGVLPGDIIKKVDDIEYTGEDLEKVATYIKGEEGTKVKLTIQREKEEITFEIERKKIDLYPVKAEVLEHNIGYIMIESFDEKCAAEFKEKYKELSKQNIQALILDLRNNGGGIVDEALEIADTILAKGDVIITTKNKDGEEQVEKSEHNPIIDLPIVVLTNENTASASEILAVALKEHKKATVIGEKTYGKGLIQELITLTDGSGIKVTCAEYYTPNGNRINQIGITPDKEISLPEDVVNYKKEREKDAQLQEAISFLK